MSKKTLIILLLLFLFISVQAAIIPAKIFATAGTGYWSTKNGKIIDSQGNVVRIAGVNWGFNVFLTQLFGELLGSRKANYKDMMNSMKNYGFNTIRLTWRDEHTEPNCQFDNSGNKNSELVGLSCLEVIDKIVEYANQINLRIILDHHSRNRRGFEKATWIPAWQKVARRFKGNETIIGADLDNEPNGNWGEGGSSDWHSAAQKAGNAILAINPNWLIIVEDFPGTYNLVNLVLNKPIKINIQKQLVYSIHEYDMSSASEKWDQSFGNLVKQKTAPVLVGEFNLHTSQYEWFDSLLQYLKRNDIGATGWAWLYDDPKYANEPWYFKSLINPDYLTLQDDPRKTSFAKWYVKLTPLTHLPTSTPTPTSASQPTSTPTTTPSQAPTTTPTITLTTNPTSGPTQTPTATVSPTPNLKPGDANGDGHVNGLDYVIWLNNYGNANPRGAIDGDFNSPPDGKVDGLDYVIWVNNAD